MTCMAALDLGSNSFHLLVGDLADSRRGTRLKRARTRKVGVRLAEPVATAGRLGKAGRGRAHAAVQELLEVADDAGATDVVAVATEAIRAAEDGGRLCAELEERHGVRVRVLDGLEEAALSTRGVAAALELRGGQEALVLDMGGGSLEVGLGGPDGLREGASLPLGGARLTTRGYADPPWLAERAGLRGEALELLADVAHRVHQATGGRPPRAVGTAGTVRDLGRVGLALASGVVPNRVRGLVVTRAQLELGYARLCGVPLAERADVPGASAKRADLLPVAGAVVLAAMEALDLPQLELCDWGLREGVLLDVAGAGEVVGPADATPLGGA